MKYFLGKKAITFEVNQKVVSEQELEFNHQDLMNANTSWYSRGYTTLKMTDPFIDAIKTNTKLFIGNAIKKATGTEIASIDKYHHHIKDSRIHLAVLQEIGKLIQPKLLGIDVNALEQEIKHACAIDFDLTCNNVSDLRIFRPYHGDTMDNNPLHRDTWLTILNNCINVYIPVFGNTQFSSLSLIPKSHLWNRDTVERTVDNAKIKNIQYGLPSVTRINREFEVLRPNLSGNKILLFSPNIIHGGAVNLNKDTTRVSIEIRFWRQK